MDLSHDRLETKPFCARLRSTLFRNVADLKDRHLKRLPVEVTSYFWIIAFDASLLFNLSKIIRLYHLAPSLDIWCVWTCLGAIYAFG